MKIKVLQSLKIGTDQQLSLSTSAAYSAYFSHGYKIDKKSDDTQMENYFSKYKESIERVHMPPEYNFRNLDSTVDLLRLLVVNLKIAGYEKRIGVDAHAGHSIELSKVEENLRRLDLYLKKLGDPEVYLSIENVNKSALSSTEEILNLARYIYQNKLDRIKITIDVKDLMETERGDIHSFVDLIKKMQSEGILDVVSCVHTPTNLAKTLEKEVEYIPGNIDLVTED